MKRKFLPILATALFAMGGLIACGEQPKDYNIVINNKDELTAEWHVKESARKVDFTINPEVNYDEAYKNGQLKVVAVDTSIVSVSKYMITPVAAGTTDVSVSYTYKYNNEDRVASDTITVTVGEEQTEPAVKSATIKEVLEAIKSDNQHKQKYKITGTVKAWSGTNSDGTKYGNFYLNDGSTTDNLYVYGATANAEKLVWDNNSKKYVFTNPQDFLTNAKTKDIVIGSILEMEVDTLMYNTTKEAEGIVTKVTAGAKVNPTAIKLSGVPGQIEVGYYYPTTIGFEPADTTEKKVTWASADATKASVDTKGGVFGVAEGTGIKISATSQAVATVIGEETVNVIKNRNPECENQLPAAGQFKAGFVQSTLHDNYYLDGTINNGFLQSTLNGKSAGATIELVANGGGLSIKLGEGKYVGFDGTKLKEVAAVADAGVFTVDSTFNTLKATIKEADYALASYGTYKTVGLSKYSYCFKDSSVIPGQNILHFYKVADPKDPSKVVLDFSADNKLPSKDNAADGVEFTASGVAMKTNKGYQGTNFNTGANEYIMLKNADNACMWNTAAISQKIASITIKTGSSSSPGAIYAVTFGSAEQSGQKGSAETGIKIGTNNSYTFTAPDNNSTFFNVSAYTKNCQVAELTINYVVE